MKILIDPGHGIDTPGKRSPDGLFREYLFNRQVSDLVLTRLRDKGLDADLVVTETNDIALRTRAMRVNRVCDRYGAGNVILLSIHANASGLGTDWMNAKGWSVYTTRGETRADMVAECLHIAFAKAFPERKMRQDLSDGDSDYEMDFYIIKKTRCPAVLLENFFYDNHEECQWLLQPRTRERIADAIVDGLLLYLGMA